MKMETDSVTNSSSNSHICAVSITAEEKNKYEKMIQKDARKFHLIPNNLQFDKEFIIKIMNDDKYSTNLYNELSDEMKNDKDIALCAMNNTVQGSAFKDMPQCMRDDKDISMIRMIKDHGWDYPILSDILKNDKDIVYTAIKYCPQTGHIMKNMPNELKNDRAFMIRLINEFSGIYPKISLKLQKDKEIANLAFSKYGEGKKYADNSIMKKEKTLSIVLGDGSKLHSLSDEFKNDKDVVIYAIYGERGFTAFDYIGDTLKNDKEFMNLMKKLKESNISLKYAPVDIRNNRDIIKRYICEEGRTEEFQYASDKIRNDKEFIIDLIEQNSEELFIVDLYDYIGDKLKNDIDVAEVFLEFVEDYDKNDLIKKFPKSIIDKL